MKPNQVGQTVCPVCLELLTQQAETEEGEPILYYGLRVRVDNGTEIHEETYDQVTTNQTDLRALIEAITDEPELINNLPILLEDVLG